MMLISKYQVLPINTKSFLFTHEAHILLSKEVKLTVTTIITAIYHTSLIATTILRVGYHHHLSFMIEKAGANKVQLFAKVYVL